ncbi:FAD/NAD(P)-binding domain-containing protein [Teratosphaeria nubilosa]|uniref:FAD/NAD(P)-binding domain-containing protein n=1 Tax=Teratosphaeria nubilosa TaxID=161662 RepID=A0A6G1LHB7_9PEZI|nr:FAD/NAD(P)-binding domain-containing protein [Teratosphaeria nubilosa]
MMPLIETTFAIFRIIVWACGQLLLVLRHPRDIVFGHQEKFGIVHRTASVDTRRQNQSRKLSKPLANIKGSYDSIVIGSGYGGGVAASRMARSQPKQTVCVLERGLERWPGQYPAGWWQVLKDMRIVGIIDLPYIRRFSIRIGRATGLYHWVFGRSGSVYVGSGLGGTSLLNANAFVRADPAVLRSSAWPEELRLHGALDQYYRHAEDVLEPTTCPADGIAKFSTLQKQAGAAGLLGRFGKVPLTTSFQDRKTSAGVQVKASSLNGKDCLGQNDGSKISTLVTYLADAWCHGADIFCSTKVEYVAPSPAGGYTIYFRDASKTGDELSWVHAKRFVFLGAGPVGTTEILLRSKAHGLSMSDGIGTGMSANGCTLAFGEDLDLTTNPVASDKHSKSPPGPTITGCIDCQDVKTTSDRLLIQEGSFPPAAAIFFQWTNWSYKRLSDRRPWLRWVIKQLFRALRGGRSNLQNTQVYLSLGHDKANGTLQLDRDNLKLDMRDIAIQSSQRRLYDILAAMTNAFHGVLKTPRLKFIVHPLGGACYASDGTSKTGCLSHTGELLTGNGSEAHKGLTVVDAAAIPTSLGANPLATITAMAERSVSLVAANAGLSIDYATKSQFESQWRRESTTALRPGIDFREIMAGTLTAGHRSSAASLDVKVLLTRSEDGKFSQGALSGTLQCPVLSKDPLVIQDGIFRLFEVDSTRTERLKMSYTMTAITSAGKELYIRAEKVLGPEVCFSISRLWAASTTLYTSIRSLDDTELASGTLHLTIAALANLLSTLRPKAEDKASAQRLQLAFLVGFAAKLMRRFFSPFMPLQFAEDVATSTASLRPHPKPSSVHTIVASDGQSTTLRRYEPLVTDTKPRGDILFVPGAAVTYEIFAMPTAKINAMTFFTAAGYRCWILEHRLCKTEEADGQAPWTHYDIRLDIVAALNSVKSHISEATKKPYMVVHCSGAVACASGLLDGAIQADSVAGITASNAFTHPILVPVNEVKAKLPLLHLYRALAGDHYPTTISRHTSPVQRVLTELLRLYPPSRLRDLCTSATCLRSQLAFGRMWSHHNFTVADHDYLHQVMGGVHTRALQLLKDMALLQEVTDDTGRSLVTPTNLQRLRGLRLFLFSNAESDVYSPQATARTAEVLTKISGSGMVRRKVFENFGHLDCWMSEKAAEKGSVYQTVLEEIEEAVAAEPEDLKRVDSGVA